MKIYDKLLNSFKDDYNFLSKKTLEFSLKKDYAKKAWSNQIEINKQFNHIIDTAIKIYTYLQDDFNLTKFGNDRISDELSDLKQYKKKLSSSYVLLKRMKQLNYSQTLQRWQALSIFIDEFPKLLNFLNKVSGSITYKDIDIQSELDNVNNIIYLKEDFTLLKSLIKADYNVV